MKVLKYGILGLIIGFVGVNSSLGLLAFNYPGFKQLQQSPQSTVIGFNPMPDIFHGFASMLMIAVFVMLVALTLDWVFRKAK